MKTLYTLILILVASEIVVLADSDKRIRLEGITSIEQITGYLNKPFGSIVDVKGRVKFVPPIKGQRKAPQDRYFVVTHVEGRKLEETITFDLWSRSLPDAKHGDLISSKAYERLMMLGTPVAARSGIGYAGTAKDVDFRIWRYIHILPEK